MGDVRMDQQLIDCKQIDTHLYTEYGRRLTRTATASTFKLFVLNIIHIFCCCSWCCCSASLVTFNRVIQMHILHSTASNTKLRERECDNNCVTTSLTVHMQFIPSGIRLMAIPLHIYVCAFGRMYGIGIRPRYIAYTQTHSPHTHMSRNTIYICVRWNGCTPSKHEFVVNAAFFCRIENI